MRVNRRRLQRTAQKLLRAEGCPETCEVSVLLTDDAHIAELNRHYRGTDRPTDVLAFYTNAGLDTGSPTGESVVLGDVVISVETAKRQADERGKSLDDELDLLIAHGVLHLLGYTDDTEEAASRMQEEAAEIIGREAAR